MASGERARGERESARERGKREQREELERGEWGDSTHDTCYVLCLFCRLLREYLTRWGGGVIFEITSFVLVRGGVGGGVRVSHGMVPLYSSFGGSHFLPRVHENRGSGSNLNRGLVLYDENFVLVHVKENSTVSWCAGG